MATVEVHQYPPEHQESLCGVLAGFVKKTIPPERWTEACEEAWSEAVSREWNANEASE
jgi:hypothetical protein